MRKRGRFEAPPAPRPSWKTTNRHLQMMVTSAVSMLLCCTMLLGTTMAWFTDTITSSLNMITIGTLGIALKHGNTYLKTGDTLFHGNSDGETNGTESQSNNSWGKDFYQSKVLTVENTGDLSLKYELRFLSDGTGNVSAARLFDVYVNEKSADMSNLDLDHPVPAQETVDGKATNALSTSNGWTHVGSLQDFLDNQTPVSFGMLAPKGSTSFAIALHMKDADDSAQGSSLTLNIQLFAYQSNAPDLTPPSTPTKTAVISELDESEDTEELKTTTKLNSVLKNSSLNKDQLTNSTLNTDNLNVTNDNNSSNGDNADTQTPDSDSPDDDDDDAQIPDSGTTGGNDDGTPVPDSGSTGGNDDGTPVPDSGSTDGNDDGTPVPDSGSTGGDDEGTPVPDSDTTGGDDDGTPVPNSDTTGGDDDGTPDPNSDTTGGDDDGTPDPNSGDQSGSEADSGQDSGTSTSAE